VYTRIPGCPEARPKVRFQGFGGKIRFRGENFCFYYVFERNFSGHNKIWGGTKIFGCHCPRIPPEGAGLPGDIG